MERFAAWTRRVETGTGEIPRRGYNAGTGSIFESSDSKFAQPAESEHACQHSVPAAVWSLGAGKSRQFWL